jgi:hypothetical protein
MPSTSPRAGCCCPLCGEKITKTQFVFYPKPNRVRCRACRTELKYPIPFWKKVVLGLTGALFGFGALIAFVILLTAAEVPAGPWSWFALFAFAFAVCIPAAYVEAAYVLKRFRVEAA